MAAPAVLPLFVLPVGSPFSTPIHMFLVLSISQHAPCLRASYQHVSLSASLFPRQAFLSRELLQLQSCLLFSIHLSIPSLHGFVLFSAAINLLANRSAEPSSGCRHQVSGYKASEECRSLNLTLHYGETHKPRLAHFARPHKSHVYFK